jgi:UDP-3-O-[3-hydroxymyristoyl] glucosamine N-acyltransferase
LEIPLKEIARAVGGEVIGDDGILITGINSLDSARPGEISFYTNRRYKESLSKTEASAILVSKPNKIFRGPQVVVVNPGLGHARIAALFAASVPRYPGVSEQAILHESCRIGENVSIYPSAYVGKEALLGDEVILFPGVYVGDRVRIGDRTVVYPNVSILQDCIVGKDVIIHAGTVIGSDGFGFVRDGSVAVKVPQIGIVQIDDEVEIGASNCIDRAAFGKTWIKRGVKTDNLVQVGHNVVIGEDTIIVAQAGIAGSVQIGKEVIIGGQVGIADHIEIGDRAMIGSQSGVGKPVPSGHVVSGSPTMPHHLFLKTSKLVRRLPDFNERLRKLEKRMQALEQQSETADRPKGEKKA